nr:uncharacterized protein LOC114083376 [Marmota flaviventris]
MWKLRPQRSRACHVDLGSGQHDPRFVGLQSRAHSHLFGVFSGSQLLVCQVPHWSPQGAVSTWHLAPWGVIHNCIVTTARSMVKLARDSAKRETMLLPKASAPSSQEGESLSMPASVSSAALGTRGTDKGALRELTFNGRREKQGNSRMPEDDVSFGEHRHEGDIPFSPKPCDRTLCDQVLNAVRANSKGSSPAGSRDSGGN